MLLQRKSIICRSQVKHDCIPIFQIHPISKVSTIRDIEEYIDVSKSMKTENGKRDYFASNGLDYDKVKEYYDIVSNFERLYTSNNSNKFKNKLMYISFIFTIYVAILIQKIFRIQL